MNQGIRPRWWGSAVSSPVTSSIKLWQLISSTDGGRQQHYVPAREPLCRRGRQHPSPLNHPVGREKIQRCRSSLDEGLRNGSSCWLSGERRRSSRLRGQARDREARTCFDRRGYSHRGPQIRPPPQTRRRRVTASAEEPPCPPPSEPPGALAEGLEDLRSLVLGGTPSRCR